MRARWEWVPREAERERQRPQGRAEHICYVPHRRAKKTSELTHFSLVTHTHTRTHSSSHAESWIVLQGTCSVTWTSLHQQRESFALSGLFEVISSSVIKRRNGQMHLPSTTTLWQPWGYLLSVMCLWDRHTSTPVICHHLRASEHVCAFMFYFLGKIACQLKFT